MRLSTYRTIFTIWATAWAPLALGGTIIFGATYGAMQQGMRQDANDPQIQLAQDGAAALAQGFSTTSVLLMAGNYPIELDDHGTMMPPHIDMIKSRGTFVEIFDDSGALLGSTGFINGAVPIPPAWTFDYARENRENRLTWQPSSKVRIAAVIEHYDSGFVLVGRSLREAESRIRQLGLIMASGWAIFLVVTLVGVAYKHVQDRIRDAEDYIARR